jgi:hypothetical protein
MQDKDTTPHGMTREDITSIKTRQDKQDETRQDKTRQEQTKPDKPNQDKTRQDKTRPDQTRQDQTDKTSNKDERKKKTNRLDVTEAVKLCTRAVFHSVHEQLERQ